MGVITAYYRVLMLTISLLAIQGFDCTYGFKWQLWVCKGDYGFLRVIVSFYLGLWVYIGNYVFSLVIMGFYR